MLYKWYKLALSLRGMRLQVLRVQGLLARECIATSHMSSSNSCALCRGHRAFGRGVATSMCVVPRISNRS